MPATRKARIIVAGQLPPPVTGQNVMIAQILAEFLRCPSLECEHLVFGFTPHAAEMRRGSAKKILELLRVLARLLALRTRGPIDLLLFPAGGPQTVPLLRDVFLLPFVLLAARRVVVQFHAAGVAERCQQDPSLLCVLIRALYRRCHAAIVMTAFNRRDPEFLGLRRIAVIPHRLADEFDAGLIQRSRATFRLLYVGHLCAEKGTPDLLHAFAALAARHRDVVLELVGETLPPFSPDYLLETIRGLGLEGRVELAGLLTGRAKQEAFARADVFVFPSVAPYESFGLVLVEAMMWGLPIVATDWRGNRDVLGPDFEGLCGPMSELAGALETALAHCRAHAWTGRNRQLFLDRYRLDVTGDEYPRRAAEWLARA